jgi:hypothetical protein
MSLTDPAAVAVIVQSLCTDPLDRMADSALARSAAGVA